jgi:hypothetical protein
MTSSGPDRPPAGQPGPSQPGPPQPGPPPAARPTAVDLRRLAPADLGLVVAAVLYLVLGCLPWASVDFFAGRFSVNGFRFSGLVTVSLVLLIAAAVWSLLPAVTEVRLQFPRHGVSGGLAALAVLMTLIAWLRSLDYGFAAAAFLGLLVTLAALGLALLGLLPEMYRVPSLRSRAGAAAQWAGRPVAPSAGPAAEAPGGGPAYGHPGWQPPGSAAPWPAPAPVPPSAPEPPAAEQLPVYTPPPPTAPPARPGPPPAPPVTPQPSAEEADFWRRPGAAGAQPGPDGR